MVHAGLWGDKKEKKMDTIYKYETPINDYFSLNIPEGAEILSYQLQGVTPCIWFKVDPARPIEERNFLLVGTGHPIKEKNITFIDSIQLEGGRFVFHLFELLN